MCHAVRNTRGRAAACGKSRPAGWGTPLAARAVTYSRQPPSKVSPRIPYSRHSGSFPDRHALHRPHERPGATTTRSPAAIPVTPGPSASTSPATSQPGTIGSGNLWPATPRRTQRSRWLSPTARTAHPDLAGPGLGDRLLFETEGLEPAVLPDHDGAHRAHRPRSIQTLFVSRYPSRASTPRSRPNPLCLNPPNGSDGSKRL